MLKLYNTLSRKIEEFVPIDPPNVGMYTCGPTVYGPGHLGHARSYTNFDLLKRVLLYNDFKVKHILNITDVHDDMIKKADELGITIKDLTNKYMPLFQQDLADLNILPADFYPKVTENIPEIIAMIKTLINKDFAYVEKDGVYFDVSKFKDYGKLSGRKLEQAKTGTRVESDKYERDNAADFALWKLALSQVEQGEKGGYLWDSPWGKGRPGWHIECSVMAKKYLSGERSRTIDIHAGAMDLKFPHHENEIAQSEAAYGTKFVNYWIHAGLLDVEGQKMSKSLGNYIEIHEIKDKEYNPLALRYLFLTVHYRDTLNFTWDGLGAAQTALKNLQSMVVSLRRVGDTESSLSADKLDKLDQYRSQFLEAINSDLAIPRALAITWEMLKSQIPAPDKLDLLLEFDKVLGLNLSKIPSSKLQAQIPEEIKKLVDGREQLRKAGKWQKADEFRKKIEQAGFKVEDIPGGSKLTPDHS